MAGGPLLPSSIYVGGASGNLSISTYHRHYGERCLSPTVAIGGCISYVLVRHICLD